MAADLPEAQKNRENDHAALFKALLVNGAGDLDFDQVACESLFVEVNGAGDAKLSSLNIRKKLKVEVNGAGDVDITGRTQDVSLEVNGVGDIDATGLKVEGEVKQRKSGIATIRI